MDKMGFYFDDENVAFVDAKIEIEELRCPFCKELPTDPKVTRCCSKYVCFQCWILETRKLENNYDTTHEMYWRCLLCHFNDEDTIIKRLQHIEDKRQIFRIFLDDPSSILKKKLDDVLVKCPDKDCKVKSETKSLFI